MTKEERDRIDHIKLGVENDYYVDADATADLKFLWEQYQKLLPIT